MSDFVRLGPLESSFALPLPGTVPPASETSPRESPREALEALVRPAVERETCYVLFSGGRDSSAILALAVAVARRIGADDPVPVTVVHPAAPGSDESEWQSLVLTHLGINQRMVLNFDGEQAWLGDAARESLGRHGLLWPPAIHLHGAIYRNLSSGASLLSGEGGDMSIDAQTISPLVEAVRALRPRRALRELIALATYDDGVRLAALAGACPWLTDEGRELLLATYREPREPLRWSAELKQAAFSRTVQLAGSNFLAKAERYGLVPTNPLEHARFIHALARAGGWWGLGDRTDMMRLLFADLLPDSILSRTTKAYFNETRWTVDERNFAQDWTGDGIDTRINDAERLRSEWLSEHPFTLSAFHLHAAWLASHGLPLAPDGS